MNVCGFGSLDAGWLQILKLEWSAWPGGESYHPFSLLQGGDRKLPKTTQKSVKKSQKVPTHIHMHNNNSYIQCQLGSPLESLFTGLEQLPVW